MCLRGMIRGFSYDIRLESDISLLIANSPLLLYSSKRKGCIDGSYSVHVLLAIRFNGLRIWHCSLVDRTHVLHA